MRHHPLAPLLIAAISTFSATASATSHARSLRVARLDTTTRKSPLGTSVGSPTNGHLIGGAHLDETAYLRVVPSYASGDSRWGLAALVGMIDRAARQVRHQFAGTVTSVGHLSKAGGGEIDRHASHESGRDADVAFFVKSASGKQIFSDHFVPFRGDGTAPSWPGASFDDAKNWAFVSALVSDPAAHVSHVFVSLPMRARLLAYAVKVGASQELREHVASVLAQPHGALPHDDHFHVRISCPSGMSQCVENPPPRGLVARRHHGKGTAPSDREGHPHGRVASRGAGSPPHASGVMPAKKRDDDRTAKDDEDTPIFTPETVGTVARGDLSNPPPPTVNLARPLVESE